MARRLGKVRGGVSSSYRMTEVKELPKVYTPTTPIGEVARVVSCGRSTVYRVLSVWTATGSDRVLVPHRSLPASLTPASSAKAG